MRAVRTLIAARARRRGGRRLDSPGAAAARDRAGHRVRRRGRRGEHDRRRPGRSCVVELALAAGSDRQDHLAGSRHAQRGGAGAGDAPNPRAGRPDGGALLWPVRLGGIVVRPAAIAPLTRWVSGAAPGPCRPRAVRCCWSAATLPRSARALTTFGVRITVAGGARLRSAAPLGFTPGGTSGEPPLLVTGDVAGLESLGGLSGVYRTHSWLSVPALATLHSWQLRSFEARLQRAQTQLLTSGSLFSLSGPFNALDAARTQAAAAPKRLLAGRRWRACGAGAVPRARGGRAAARPGCRRRALAGRRSPQRSVPDVRPRRVRVAVRRSGCSAAPASHSPWPRCSPPRAGLPAGAVLAHSLLTPVALVALVGRADLRDSTTRQRCCSPAWRHARRCCSRSRRSPRLALALQSQRERQRPTDRAARPALLPGRRRARVSGCSPWRCGRASGSPARTGARSASRSSGWRAPRPRRRWRSRSSPSASASADSRWPTGRRCCGAPPTRPPTRVPLDATRRARCRLHDAAAARLAGAVASARRGGGVARSGAPTRAT